MAIYFRQFWKSGIDSMESSPVLYLLDLTHKPFVIFVYKFAVNVTVLQLILFHSYIILLLSINNIRKYKIQLF